MTAEQINMIARLPADADFRFTREYGITIVVATHGRQTIRIYEDGSHQIEIWETAAYYMKPFVVEPTAPSSSP